MRGKAIEKFIEIGWELYLIKNYHTAYSVITGIKKPPIWRLNFSWICVDDEHKVKLQKIDSSFSDYDNFEALKLLC